MYLILVRQLCKKYEVVTEMTTAGVRSVVPLNLDSLQLGLPGITPVIGSSFAEASRLCFCYHGHPVGVQLIVEGDFTATYEVSWSGDVTDQERDSWQDQQELTESGACGVAILLILELTEYTVIRRAMKGTGIDYWLGHKEDTAPFQSAARLEISGILSGDSSKVQHRVREKLQQTSPTDGKLTAHVVVVEFSRPTASVLVKA